MNGAVNELRILQDEIAECRICSQFAADLGKTKRMERGNPCASVMIIGEAPGRTELQKEKAFSGQAGRRLDDWLAKCGANPLDPRQEIYVTSVLKCSTSSPNVFSSMAINCSKFLHRQLLIVQPQLVITLGANAYSHLRLNKSSYEAALCRVFHSADYYLFPPYWDDHFELLVWPHPSGRNLWLNEKTNFTRLSDSFEYVRAKIVK